MYNCKNNGTVIGILASASKNEPNKAYTSFNPNKDGSVRVAISVLAGDNFKSRFTQTELDSMSPEVRAKKVDANGKGYKSQRVSLTQFLPYDKQAGSPRGLGIYNKLHAGDLVCVNYSVRSGRYTKDGVETFTQTLEIEGIQVIKHAPANTTTPIVDTTPDTADEMTEGLCEMDGDEAF